MNKIYCAFKTNEAFFLQSRGDLCSSNYCEQSEQFWFALIPSQDRGGLGFGFPRALLVKLFSLTSFVKFQSDVAIV